MVAAVAVAGGLGALAVKAGVDAATRGYSSTRGARIVRYTLVSKLLGRSLREVAVVPPGNEARPLLVLLHGRRGRSRLAWLLPARSGPESMLSDALFTGLARLGTRAPVVVFLNGGGDSYYHDRHDGPWAKMIVREAIPDAVRRFGTTGRRVAIGGISMGGFGAFHLAAVDRHAFCAVGGHSAALWQSAGATAPGAFDDAADYARNDVFAAARHGAFDHQRALWLDTGSDDPFRAADAAFATLLRHRGLKVAYHVWPGGHTSSYWRAHLAVYLRFYAAALARCRL